MNKFHATKTKIDGIKFDSRIEAERYIVLKAMQNQGLISGLELQVRYKLIPNIYETINGKRKCVERGVDYVADFVYTDNTGKKIVEDVKGMRTPAYIIKRKLMRWTHGIQIKEYPEKGSKCRKLKR